MKQTTKVNHKKPVKKRTFRKQKRNAHKKPVHKKRTFRKQTRNAHKKTRKKYYKPHASDYNDYTHYCSKINHYIYPTIYIFIRLY